MLNRCYAHVKSTNNTYKTNNTNVITSMIPL